MDLGASTSISPAAMGEVPQVALDQSRAPSWLTRLLAFPVKLFWGMAFCQGLVGSILVVGWSYRFAQRSALKYWWSRRAESARGMSFAEFLAGSETTRPHRHWPNWFCQQNLREAFRRCPGASTWEFVRGLLAAPVHSLWLNFWIGLRGILNTWVVTLPAGIFWWFGWYDGWNNSFNKGYEQAPVGPQLAILGIVLFIAAMLYLPLAQARQAVSGQWRAFYDFRLVRAIWRLRWPACVGLALLYVAFALPLNVLKTTTTFWPQGNPALEQASSTQLLKALNGYFFWCALVMLPAYVILRVIAARIYASGILSAVQSGTVPFSALQPNEREALERLGLLVVLPQRDRHPVVRIVAWTGSRVGRIAGGTALCFIWFLFVAQIYVAEFLQYHQALGWLNQPLVQLPWFHYLPTALKKPSDEVVGAVLAFLVACLIASVVRHLGPRRTPGPERS